MIIYDYQLSWRFRSMNVSGYWFHSTHCAFGSMVSMTDEMETTVLSLIG